MNANTLDKVISFVSEFCVVNKNKLTLQTQLGNDLGIDGDDAIEFMEAFSENFEVDLTEFEYSKYFGPEGFNPFAYLYYYLFKRDKLKLIPITLHDLVEAAEANRWIKQV